MVSVAAKVRLQDSRIFDCFAQALVGPLFLCVLGLSSLVCSGLSSMA